MHIPVLLTEVLEYLRSKNGGVFIDGTIGGGGHTIEILKAHKNSRVLGIDLDQTSLEKLKERLIQEGLSQRCTLVQGNYSHLQKFADQEEIGSVDGILLDLGFSSFQVDNDRRGFSFQSSGPLDMRYDSNAELTAAQVVNSYHEKELVRVLKEFGEERFARRIAISIVRARKIKHLETTEELAEAVRQAIPVPLRFKSNDNIRRVFQAIRIEVNSELENLKKALPQALSLLEPGGRLAVISFHSLEDRIVKEFFSEQAKGCVCPPEFPTCICGKSPSIRVLTRKPIEASEKEIKANSRSKPAKMRVAQKI